MFPPRSTTVLAILAAASSFAATMSSTGGMPSNLVYAGAGLVNPFYGFEVGGSLNLQAGLHLEGYASQGLGRSLSEDMSTGGAGLEFRGLLGWRFENHDSVEIAVKDREVARSGNIRAYRAAKFMIPQSRAHIPVVGWVLLPIGAGPHRGNSQTSGLYYAADGIRFDDPSMGLLAAGYRHTTQDGYRIRYNQDDQERFDFRRTESVNWDWEQVTALGLLDPKGKAWGAWVDMFSLEANSRTHNFYLEAGAGFVNRSDMPEGLDSDKWSDTQYLFRFTIGWAGTIPVTANDRLPDPPANP